MEPITSPGPEELVMLTDDELDYVAGGQNTQILPVALLNGVSLLSNQSGNFSGNAQFDDSTVNF